MNKYNLSLNEPVILKIIIKQITTKIKACKNSSAMCLVYSQFVMHKQHPINNKKKFSPVVMKINERKDKKKQWHGWRLIQNSRFLPARAVLFCRRWECNMRRLDGGSKINLAGERGAFENGALKLQTPPPSARRGGGGRKRGWREGGGGASREQRRRRHRRRVKKKKGKKWGSCLLHPHRVGCSARMRLR